MYSPSVTDKDIEDWFVVSASERKELRVSRLPLLKWKADTFTVHKATDGKMPEMLEIYE